jgi:hypothetical protein
MKFHRYDTEPAYGLLVTGIRCHSNRNMKRRIRELIHATPFLPFVIRMADGREYRIEHPDIVLAAANDVRELRSKNWMGASTISLPY